MKFDTVKTPDGEHKQVAVVANGFAITDPTVSECGRFDVDPMSTYGIKPRVALALKLLNAALREEPPLSNDPAQFMGLVGTIDALVDSASEEGCSDDLTVVSANLVKALQARVEAMRSHDPKQQAYLDKHGQRCPQCGSDAIEGHSVAVDNLTASQEVTCNSCGAAWNDLYSLQGFELLEEGDGNAESEEF